MIAASTRTMPIGCSASQSFNAWTMGLSARDFTPTTNRSVFVIPNGLISSCPAGYGPSAGCEEMRKLTKLKSGESCNTLAKDLTQLDLDD
jgi:hypothetical protein